MSEQLQEQNEVEEEKSLPIPTPAELVAAGWKVRIKHQRWYSPNPNVRTIEKDACYDEPRQGARPRQ